MGFTKLQQKQRQETDDRVMDAFENNGALSMDQLVSISRLPRATAELALARLRDDGQLRKLPEKMPVGKGGCLACVYDLGMDEDFSPKSVPFVFTVHRHPQDVALFGEYAGIPA